MGLSTVTRVGIGVVLFVLIARALGPVEFGHYMFWYGVTYLCSVGVNFGLSNMLLKEIAQSPDEAHAKLCDALALRATLAGVVFTVGLLGSFYADRPALLLLLLIANLAEVISDTFYVTYRAKGHYASEVRLATLSAIVQFGFVASAVLSGQETAVIALAFLLGRGVQLLIIVVASRPAFGSLAVPAWSRVSSLASRAKAYAADFALSNTFGNIDSVILRILVGVEAVGLFQSGMRIFMGGAQGASILANVFLPSMARASATGSQSAKASRTLQGGHLLLGAGFGLTLAFFPDEIVAIFFGSGYQQLSALLPLFGFLFFVRLFAASWGLILTAAGHQGYRARASAIHLVVAFLVGCVLAPEFGVSGWLISLVVASSLLGAMYMAHAVKSGAASSSPLCTVLTLAGCAIFVSRFI